LQRLPDRDAPLVDRLFALECAARGGAAVAPAVERYHAALREAQWYLDDTWEPDVPHAAVVGQALSATAALGQTPPSTWTGQLQEAVDGLERRTARLGIGGDPSLLAAVLRGLDAADLRAPDWLIQAASGVLEASASVEGTAELAEALSRHPGGGPLVATTVSAAFNGRGLEGPDAAYARWWLASRRQEADQYLSAQAVDDARLQALVAADSTVGKPAAMVMEAAARAAGQLVIASPATLSAARSRDERRVRVSRAVYRALLFIGLCVFGLFALRDIASSVSDVVGADDQSGRKVIAFLLVASVFATLSGTANAVAETYGKKPPRWVQQLEGIGIGAAGLIAALVA
jgi:hypothetical protein